MEIRAEKTQYPAMGYAIFCLAIFMIAALLSLLDRQILSLLVGAIRHDLQISDTQVSLLQGVAFALFYTFMGLPLGWLVDRVNRRNLIITGLLVWSLMTIACGLSVNFWQLFLARVGVGVGEACLHPAVYSLITDLFPAKYRARAFSAFGAAATGGIALSFLFGGIIIALAGHATAVDMLFLGPMAIWKAVFIFAGLPGVLLSALMMAMKEVKRTERHAAPSKTVGAVRPSLGKFLKRNWQTMTIILVPNALIVFVGYGMMAWMPTAFIRTYGVTPAKSGMLCGLIMIISATAGSLLGGILADYWSNKGVAGGKLLAPVCTGVFASITFTLCWAVNDLTLAVTFCAIAFSMQVVTSSCAPAIINELVPNELRGQMSALFLLINGVTGIGLGPTTVALVTDYVFKNDLALRYSLIVVAGPSLLLAAAIAWFGRHTYSRTVAACRAEISKDPIVPALETMA